MGSKYTRYSYTATPTRYRYIFSYEEHILGTQWNSVYDRRWLYEPAPIRVPAIYRADLKLSTEILTLFLPAPNIYFTVRLMQSFCNMVAFRSFAKLQIEDQYLKLVKSFIWDWVLTRMLSFIVSNMNSFKLGTPNQRFSICFYITFTVFSLKGTVQRDLSGWKWYQLIGLSLR